MTVRNNTMTGNIANALNGGDVIYNLGNMTILNLTYIENKTVVVSPGIILLNATIVDDMGNKVTGQLIHFWVNGTYIGNATAIEGLAQINYTVPKFNGVLPVNGTYQGSGNLAIDIYNGELLVVDDEEAANYTYGIFVNSSSLHTPGDGSNWAKAVGNISEAMKIILANNLTNCVIHVAGSNATGGGADDYVGYGVNYGLTFNTTFNNLTIMGGGNDGVFTDYGTPDIFAGSVAAFIFSILEIILPYLT
jgi:hypothetical protein